MNIIIVGCGKVGSTLAGQLSQEGHDISIIDINDQVVEEFSNSYDVMGVTGNGASYTIQKAAGIEKAHLLIAVTGSDELNLLCCLIARKAGNCKTIAKVRNPIYNREIGFIKEELGLSMAINPEYEAAREITRILRFPSVIDINTFNKGKVELLTFKINKGSVLHNMRLPEIESKLKCDILVCMVERGEEVIIPNGEFVLAEGDKISIIAPHKKATEFFVKIGMMNNPVKNSMIVGGADIAYYLADNLSKYGISITMIEKDLKRCEELSELLPEAMIINGDGTDKDLLIEEGITEETVQVSSSSLYKIDGELEEILSKIEGVGEVNVMITYSQTSQTVPLYNEDRTTKDTEETDKSGGTRKITESDSKKDIIFKESDGEKQPITQSIISPRIEGAIIAAKGAANVDVKTKIVQAVEAVTGLATHKIQVFEMQS